MASPAAETMPNGISTPPATASNAANPSPPTQSTTQPNTQNSQVNGSSQTASAAASFPSVSTQDTGSTKRPRDARLIHLMLANMGVHAYTERVPLQLLDFTYRYTSSILSDAQSYEPPAPSGPTHAKKRNANPDADAEGVSLNALRTAVAARAAGQFQGPLPKEFMLEVASERNRIALPRVEKEFGLRLPPERYCFTGVGWGVKESWEEEIEDEEMGVDEGGPVGGAGVNGNGAAAQEDADMGGMEEEEEIDQQEFEEAMGN